MKETKMTIPHLFMCPISLDLFKDPVTLCTGQTYDRSSIEKWLAAGNLTCPVTMQKLHDPSMVPNHTLRHLIHQWLQMGHQFNPDYLTTIDSLVALKHNLESHDSSLDYKLQTLETILLVSKESPSSNSSLVQLGFFPLLLKLVFEKAESVKFIEKALACVVRLLPLGELKCLNILKEESKLESFLILFELGNNMIKKSLCHVVEAICSSSSSSPNLETKELCAVLGKNHKLLHGLIHLVQHNSEASEAGIKAISALCSFESNREYLIQQGVIDGLITFILNAEKTERRFVPLAMARLEQLLCLESAKEALINNPNGVNVLVKMVFRVSDHEGSESAVNSLIIICGDVLRAREEAIGAGVLSQLLLLLQSQCSCWTKAKARTLLKLLRTKWAEEQNHV